MFLKRTLLTKQIQSLDKINYANQQIILNYILDNKTIKNLADISIFLQCSSYNIRTKKTINDTIRKVNNYYKCLMSKFKPKVNKMGVYYYFLRLYPQI